MMKKDIIKSSILLFMMVLFVSSKPKEESPEDYSNYLNHYEDFIDYCDQQQSHLMKLSLLATENADEETDQGIDLLLDFLFSDQKAVQNLYDIMYIYNLADLASRTESWLHVYKRVDSIRNSLSDSIWILDKELERYEANKKHTLSVEYSGYLRELNKLIEIVERNYSHLGV